MQPGLRTTEKMENECIQAPVKSTGFRPTSKTSHLLPRGSPGQDTSPLWALVLVSVKQISNICLEWQWGLNEAMHVKCLLVLDDIHGYDCHWSARYHPVWHLEGTRDTGLPRFLKTAQEKNSQVKQLWLFIWFFLWIGRWSPWLYLSSRILVPAGGTDGRTMHDSSPIRIM